MTKKRERLREGEELEVGEDGEYVEHTDALVEEDGGIREEEDDEALIERSRQRRLQILAKYGDKQRNVAVVPVVPVVPAAPSGAQAVRDTVPGEHAGEEATDSPRRPSPTPVVPPSAQTAPAPTPDTDSEDDMFADTPEDKPVGEARRGENGRSEMTQANVHAGREKAKPHLTKGLADSYDDAEGYYNFQVGEILGNRYEVFATHGKGVFSSVLRARDLQHALQMHATDPPEGQSTAIGARSGRTPAQLTDEEKEPCPQVAVKIIRANETMYKAGQTEKVILSKLSHADPDGTMHCVRMLDSFEYRNHLCLVFEAMDMNLRDLTKKYGRGIGLHISAVHAYATQMFVALHHLKKCGVLHADIKPDNILVNESRTAIKLCDFGSAMFSGDNTITPYLVSRFYRAPEVILGLPYDHPMDMWSVGCVIYELYTGHILFQGRTNNDMLKVMMDVKGPFSKKMLKKAEFAPRHFDVNGNWAFLLDEEDVMTKQLVKRVVENPRAVEGLTLSKRLGLAAAAPEEKRRVSQLVDLLERVLTLDPEKRLTPLEALQHPFIKGDDAANNRGEKDRNHRNHQRRPNTGFSVPRAVMRGSA